MANLLSKLTRACVYACIFFVGVSCKDTDEFFDTSSGNKDKTSVTKEPNTFDFSTTQEVYLKIDYSDFKTYGPVFFSIYHVNPFVNENTGSEFIDESITPIYGGYTDKDGKFSGTITIPAYAKRLHVVTGNFMVADRHMVVQAVNGEATAIARDLGKTTRGRAARVPGEGVSTNSLPRMSYLTTGKGTKYYKDWYTPLGTWNSASGRPDYQLAPSSANSGLIFSEEELDGLYGAACSALNSGTSVKENYRTKEDLQLKIDSEVSITVLGSSTCWNSSLGYYYYTDDNKPTSKMDLNIIMIFPNTQDGQWPRGKYPNNDYKGNIGVERGDVIALMYYPNIANGDFSGATPVFPKGTRIGFILKSNGWGCQGGDYAVNSSNSLKNIWASTTPGMSIDLDGGKAPNPNGESRAAEFSFEAANGNKYVILSFEDATDDKDYDDLVFALNPANAFEDVADIERNHVSTFGVYGFEDLWPRKADYDMNDALFEVEHVKEFFVHGGSTSGNGSLIKETFYIKTDHNFITEDNYVGVRLNTKAALSTLYAFKGTEPDMATLKTDGNKYYYPINDTFVKSSTSNTNGIYFYYTKPKINGDHQKTVYTIEVTYSAQQSDSKASVQAFLCRPDGNSYLEVHVPFEAPGPNVATRYFGLYDDCSDHSAQKNYYTGGIDNKYPFAFYLEGVKLDAFRNTLLLDKNESVPIDSLFPTFMDWSLSKGATNADWYLHPIDEGIASE